MSLTNQEQKTERDEISVWLKEREEAGRRIDPNSADVEVTFWWAQVLDPYGVLDLTSEEDCVGRSYFARSPDSDGWVSFCDLPVEAVDELWRKIRAGELVDSFEKDFLNWQ